MTKQKANVPKWGEVWFKRNGITNILSLAPMIQRHRVAFDSDKETPEGFIRVIMSLEGLFYHVTNYRTALRLHKLWQKINLSTLIKRENKPREPVKCFRHWHARV